MAVNVYDRGGHNTENYVATLVADTVDDLEDFDVSMYRPGTACLIIDTSDVYMLNSEEQWVQLAAHNNG